MSSRWSHVRRATSRRLCRPDDHRARRPARAVSEPPSEELRIRRVAERAGYDREAVDAIVDAALIAHVGTIRDGKPVVIPMLAVRDGDWLLLHGAPASGTVRRGRGRPVCVEMTLLDGLVLARSAFHHSLNYRSVVVLGEAEAISDEDERRRALEVLHGASGAGPAADSCARRPRARSGRPRCCASRWTHASAKVRGGPPSDEDEDYDWPVWAGVLPVTTSIGQPSPTPAWDPASRCRTTSVTWPTRRAER